MSSFAERVARLPHLGVGISTEYGAGATGLDPRALRRRNPERVRFLEVGCDLARGADDGARAWVRDGLPTTYHFLDVNLEEPEDLDLAWMRDTAALARELGAAWLCGDAGLWHVGPRDRGHGTLMPPVLEETSCLAMASAVRTLREATGFEVLPENPPAHAWLGRMDLGDYFARLCAEADCGMLLDVAHLAIHQRAVGCTGPGAALAGLARFPLERVVEVHVAGGTPFEHGGRTFVDDDHGATVLDETWELLGAALERAPALRAIVVECERNPIHAVEPLFARVHALAAAAGRAGVGAEGAAR
jgi:uncharacterized protein (UPF0276 family)